MKKFNNKKNYLMLTMGIFLIGLFVVSGSFAYWMWSSSENKFVLFNTSKELSEYIIYDEGESKFVGDFQVGESYLDGVHTTISIYKTEEASNVDLYATINMDINDIGENISSSKAVKWTLTKGNSSNPGEVLASGNYLGAESGESFPLYSNIEVTTTKEEYTVWLWIDASENPSDELTGEILDTLIWTQVDQITNNNFEITRLSARGGKINATVVSSLTNITSYQVTMSDEEPTEWVTITDSEQSNNYLLEYLVTELGTYYVWFMDSDGNIVGNSIEVTSLDSTPPTGTLSITGESSSLTAVLSVSDDETGVNNIYGWKLTTSDTCDSTITDFTETTESTYNFSIGSGSMYYLCSRFEDNAGNYGYESKLIQGSIANYDYTGDYQIFTVPEDGYYKIEAYGSSGYSSNNEGFGLGAYTSGIIKLSKNENLYIYVGNASSGESIVGEKAGGEATDIRLSSGESNSTEGLNSRIMVAAGGGSVSSYDSGAQGGHGGTLIGNDGIAHSTVASSGDYIGYGATQTSGGSIGSTATSGTTGGFGYGGTGGVGPGDPEHIGSDGGSGYYGGGGSAWHAGSGGGSSFISGYAGVNAITSSTDRTHTNNTLHYSSKYFIDGEMQGGINSGNGKAKITYLGNDSPERINPKLDNVRYIKDCINGSVGIVYNHWIELQAISNGINVAKGKTITGTGAIRNDSGTLTYDTVVDGIMDITTAYTDVEGGLQCVTVDLGTTYDLDEIAVWHYYGDRRTYNDSITYVSSDGNTWKHAITKYEAEDSLGKRVSAYEEDTTDEEAPTGTLSTTVSGTSITATFSNASDNGGTGIKEYQYLITTDSTCPTTGYTTSINSSYTFTVTSAGTYYVCSRIKDNVGNVSDMISTSIEVKIVTVKLDYENNIYNQDTSSWIFDGSSSINNNYSYNGTTGVAIYSNSELYTGINIPLNNDKKTNTNYELSMMAYRTGSFSGNLRAYATTLDSSGNLLSFNHGISINTSNLPTSSWTKFSYSFNSGAYASWDWIYIDYDTANQGPVYVSDIRLDEYTTSTVIYGGTYGTLPTPTRTNYAFLGWYTEPNGGGTKITSSNIVSMEDNHTLYAHWLYDATPPTISYSIAGGSYEPPQTVTITASDTGGSGFKQMVVHVYKDGTFVSAKSTDWINSSTFTVSLDSTGTWTVYTIVYDNAGNKHTQLPDNGAGWYYQTYNITSLPIYTYTGSHELIDDGSGNWRIKFYSSGTLTFTNTGGASAIDVFLVGGGGGGRSSNNAGFGGGGGGGGYTQTVRGVSVSATSYTITIGAGGGANTAGGTTSAFNYSASGGTVGGTSWQNSGGNGGSGGGGGGNWDGTRVPGAGGSNGGNGGVGNYAAGTGQGSTTCEFGESGGTLYSGGGAGGTSGSVWGLGTSAGNTGGSGGGGNSGSNATYYGGGGGGGNFTGGSNGSGTYGAGGSGYSGIVVIRNKR